MNLDVTVMCLPWNESFFHKSKLLCSLYRWSLQEHDLFFQFILDILQLFETVKTSCMHLNFWTFDQDFNMFSKIPLFLFPLFLYRIQKESIRNRIDFTIYIHIFTFRGVMITIQEISNSKKKEKKGFLTISSLLPKNLMNNVKKV